MYYEEVSMLSIVSVILSIVSVSSKSILFCYSTDKIVTIFNMLCFISDTIGVFACTSLAFIRTNNDILKYCKLFVQFDSVVMMLYTLHRFNNMVIQSDNLQRFI